jgi:hypothetical protein
MDFSDWASRTTYFFNSSLFSCIIHQSQSSVESIVRISYNIVPVKVFARKRFAFGDKKSTGNFLLMKESKRGNNAFPFSQSSLYLAFTLVKEWNSFR